MFVYLPTIESYYYLHLIIMYVQLFKFILLVINIIFSGVSGDYFKNAIVSKEEQNHLFMFL